MPSGLLPLLVAVLGVGAPSVQVESGRGTIRIDGNRLGAPIPKSLYGVFLEEINNAGEGGLYAELIQNRGFEDANVPPTCTVENGFLIPPRSDHFWEHKPVDWKMPWDVQSPYPGWSLQKEPNADAAMSVVDDLPLTSATPHALRVDIRRGTARVANDGFWGVGVTAGKQYDLSFYVRSSGSYNGPVTAQLRSASGRTIGSLKFAGIPRAGWQKITGTMTATATDPKAKFALEFSGAGTVWLDFVSLFPRDTFKGRPNGLRKDLAEMIRDLKPGFIRFPGGCYVEGLTVGTRPHWELTLGRQEDRTPTYSPWGYWNSNGFGYHEWLQFCEDVGADALYVFNVGVSCAFRSGTYLPDSEMPGLIQNTLDAIEYAVGPTTSKWGALRAKNGHPKPFPLRYVEIGNEQSGPKYGERVALFTKAIKAKYPKMNVMLSSWIAGIDHPAINAAGPIDFVDEHAYKGAYWPLANFDHFDSYPRNVDWRLYIGEFAANGGVGFGNMQATLGDAAYMMSMEKNADLVKMGSYAPLLENVNRREWDVNLIHFDRQRAFGRASYYACKMFADHLPDVNASTRVEYTAPGDGAIVGPIGLGTYGTSAEFKDIHLEQNGQAVTIERTGWKPRSGTWKSENGVLTQTTQDWDCWNFFGDGYRDLTLTLKARKLGGGEGFVVSVGNVEGRRVQFNVGGWGNNQHTIEADGLVKGTPGKVEMGRWYDVKVVTHGREISAYLDGVQVFRLAPPRLDNVLAISGYRKATREVIVKVVNPGSRPANMTMHLDGYRILAGEGSAVVLSAPRPTDENSFEEPKKIAPKTVALRQLGNEFPHTFPPYSVSILRIPAEPNRAP